MERALLRVAAVLLGVLFVSWNKGAQANPTCTPAYSSIPGHTMCLGCDRPHVEESGVTEADKQLIVNTHNHYRSTVTPPATDLTLLAWNDQLAAVAQKWALQCSAVHDRERSIPSWGVFVGQNLGMGFSNWKDAIDGWHQEKDAFTYGRDFENKWIDIANYVQIVSNTTSLVGCGYAKCLNRKYFFCNYGSGPFYDMRSVPYTKGTACSACPDHCENNLCDCGGKLCLHGGALNVKSCTCECKDIWQGPDCSELKCPEKDTYGCGWGRYTFQNCFVHPFAHNICPKMCDMCH